MAQRFHFRLETVLRMRALREREAKRRVGAKAAEIALLQRMNRETHDDIAARQEQLSGRQSGATLEPRDLIRERAWIAYLRRTIVERQAVAAEKQRELAALREQLTHARTQTRAIENLKARRLDEHKRARQQREQSEMDDVARRLQLASREFAIGAPTEPSHGWSSSDE